MPFSYQFIRHPSPDDIRQIIELYRHADWWDQHDNFRNDLIVRIVSGSHCFLAAKEGSSLIGMGRAISDKANDAYIQDVTVMPAWRRRGIGAQIVKKIVARLREDGLRWIGLIAANETHPLYRSMGFVEMPLSIPMLWNKDTETF